MIKSSMRKRLKQKRRSCALCKPHKQGWENRWKAKDRERIESSERELRAAGGDPSASDEAAAGA
jgi:hypothetical protein